MGLMDRLFSVVFGGGRNVIAETAEVFRVNSDKFDDRAFHVQSAAMAQYGAEYAHARQGWFDRFVDGINRIPRPAMALGTLGLLVAAMVDPVWFASRMQGIALVPEPLWWLLGAIVSFYFGARHQAKGQDFQRSIAQTMARVPEVVENLETLSATQATTPGVAKTGHDAALTLAAIDPRGNAALADWKRLRA
ncbi:holin family protein [Algirhabdus cladophorae]|uniref:holin family protein n=1 Tax=Algirhabdus cladophorae TaxID=3377108 RepID=UPI003B8479C0